MKILIIEDDPGITEVVEMSFELGYPDASVISARAGEDGIGLAQAEHPDIIILDLGLPDISGFEVLKKLRQFSNVPVLVLTVRSEEVDVVKALTYGADDYLTKPFRQMELVARVKAICRRRQVAQPGNFVSAGPLRFGLSITDLYFNNRRVELTNTEGVILYNLMEHIGSVVTHEDLARKIWGGHYREGMKSLRVFIRHLREKLETDPGNPQLILNKAGQGYMLAKTDLS